MRGKNTKRRSKNTKRRSKNVRRQRTRRQRLSQRRQRLSSRSRRRKFTLRGGNNYTTAGTPSPVPNVSLIPPPPPTDINKIIEVINQGSSNQNNMNKMAGGSGGCFEGVPHGKIEVPQFRTSELDGSINANSNMVKLATTYAVAQTNATNDSLVKVL